MTRDEILHEIRRTADANGGKPLGRARFVSKTGITEYEIGKHWARFTDAQREAGFEPNTLQVAHDDDFVMEKFIGLTRKLGHVPTGAEMRLERVSHDPSFPNAQVYGRFGSKNERIGKILSYCREQPKYEDVVVILEAAYTPPSQSGDERADSIAENVNYGFVYLLRGHRGKYKIGQTASLERRLLELQAASAVELKRIHSIKTDDPVGVETYWHKRFHEKRVRHEWFELNAADVEAFKRWRRIF